MTATPPKGHVRSRSDNTPLDWTPDESVLDAARRVARLYNEGMIVAVRTNVSGGVALGLLEVALERVGQGVRQPRSSELAMASAARNAFACAAGPGYIHWTEEDRSFCLICHPEIRP